MESAATKAQSVEEKKIALQNEIDAETEHIDYLKGMLLQETDEEKQRQIQAQIDSETLKADGYQKEIDGLVEHEKQVTDLKVLNNTADLAFLGSCIEEKQGKLTEMYATEDVYKRQVQGSVFPQIWLCL